MEFCKATTAPHHDCNRLGRDEPLRGTMPLSAHEVDSTRHMVTRMLIGSSQAYFYMLYFFLLLSPPILSAEPGSRSGLNPTQAGGPWSISVNRLLG